MRPVFHIELDLTLDQILARLKESIADPRCPCYGMTGKRGAEVFVTEADRHFWSPWLSLSVESRESGTLLKGRFAPYPQVWTLYLGLYFVFGLTFFASLIFGCAQWMVGEFAWGLIPAPVCVLAMVGLFLGSLYGQRRSADQMDMLHEIVHRAVECDLLGDPADVE